MEIYRFHTQVKDGDLLFNSPHHKKIWHTFLSQFEGKKVEIQVNEKKSTRSQQQNSYYWLYLGVIAKETGNSKDDLHELFKGKFLSKGIKEIFGEKVRMKASTTTLSVGRFVEYIMEIEQLTGVPAPDTKEYWGFSYHRPF